jgi:YidC/Oxa1 family membrane protein insertase
LTPTTPVTLTTTNATGQTFSITFSIDKDYLITASETVVNRGPAPVSVQPFALLNRTDKTASLDSWNIHSGPFGAFDGKVSFAPDYKKVVEGGQITNEGQTNWVGFTDIYWMSTLIPDAAPTTSAFRAVGGGVFRADLIYQPQIVAPGQQLSRTTRLFAGAKESTVLDRYEDAGITRFGLAIDWGWFRWFEKPIFWLLKQLFHFAGNFGVAIILLTVIVRGIMFPVAQRQFASMAQMRAVQPKMKALQERHKDDKAKLQEETMKLYKAEGVNPLAGCLPLILQIPVFFALYKVLMVSIEMRHQPFVLWIKDLSAPDPLHILNLFGLLPFTPPTYLAIGILAVLLGITMWLQFKLNPPAADPTQQQVFAIMPWMMMFIMAPFASGLLIYWITSNLLTIAQQKYLYSRHPQLRVQADKDAVDTKRAAARPK